MEEHRFTTYLRTKTLFKHRLKDLHDYGAVKIYLYELKKLGVDGETLYRLKQRGEIWFDSKGNFKVLKSGPIVPSLLDLTKRDESTGVITPLHVWMRDSLHHVSVEGSPADFPVYFQAFLSHRDTEIESFFTVDAFAGRVHTPVVNLKSDLRKRLRFFNRRLVSLDVKQMQPLILARVLMDAIGPNPFSDPILKGEQDVYSFLQECAGLPSRAAAKKMMFQLIFGKPMKDIGRFFKGSTKWLDWINQYKSSDEPKNPHRRERHTNLAWLLQYSEVQVMQEIWRKLKVAGIRFLSIHDDVLCLRRDRERVLSIMKLVLSAHFPSFQVVES